MRAPSLKQIAPWTRRILWINVLIFVVGQIFLATTGANPISEFMALRLSHLMEGKVWEIFTYMWVHADFLIIHIIFNMMTLYFLGRVVEFKLGGRSFLWLYILGGIASVGLFVVDIGAKSIIFGQTVDLGTGLVGASGAVCAVLGAFSLLMPDTKLVILFLPWPVRAITAVKGAVWFSIAAMGIGWIPAVHESSAVSWFFSIAHSAHLGGILFGWWFMRHLRPYNEPVYISYRPMIEDEVEIPPENMSPMMLREALDPILEKISSQGIESLSPRELEVLKCSRKIFQ